MIEINNILDVEKYIDDVDVVIFDLDDTLYSEKDYVRSGFDAIAKEFPNIDSLSQKLWNAFLENKPAIDYVLENENMLSKKQKCIDIYRNHKPTLNLYPGIMSMLSRIKTSKHLGLITDGRENGQLSKLETLGLNRVFEKIIITDSLGGAMYRKPNDRAFILMHEYFGSPFNRMCYIGDNINKDGVAPAKLGMKFIHFCNQEGLYK